jgi:hypothetical protein
VSPSFVSTSLKGIDEKSDASEQENTIKYSAGSLYLGLCIQFGSTYVSWDGLLNRYCWQMLDTISAFYLAMILHPEAQRKAQEELDRVVGTNRLPNFGDRADLPYVSVLVERSPVGFQSRR